MMTLEEILRRTMPGKDVLNLEEAACYLGLSESRLYTLCSKRLVAHYHTGRFTYFRKADLDAYMCSGERREAVADVVEAIDLQLINKQIKQSWKRKRTLSKKA